MTTGTTTTLADEIVTAYLTGDADALADICSDDVLLDVVVPTWRFQVAGRETLRQGLAHEEFLPGRRVAWHQRTETAAGVLLEVEAWAPIDGEERKWHALNHFRISEGRLVEIVQYCSGIWDAATIDRQRAEAPMVRPR